MPPTTDTAPSRRLTRAQVRIIRAVYASGEVTQEALAALFGVGRSTIKDIVQYVTWRDEECVR